MERKITPARELTYHRLDVRIVAERSTLFRAWPGAIIRNNYLYAAEQVRIADGSTLYERINRFPLSEGHPLYKNISGGFPKGLVLFPGREIRRFDGPVEVRSGDVISFSLLLIGSQADVYTDYIEALYKMCERGMGSPMVSFRLLDIYERHPSKGVRRIAVERGEGVASLCYPVSCRDFLLPDTVRRFRIEYLTPVQLYDHRSGGHSGGYQEKLNGFPSFYQMMRSLVFRKTKLDVLYGTSVLLLDDDSVDERWERDGAAAARPLLVRADLERVSVRGTPRRTGEKPILFHGYVGSATYAGHPGEYGALLLFMQELGVGNDTIYGLGQYRVTCMERKPLRAGYREENDRIAYDVEE